MVEVFLSSDQPGSGRQPSARGVLCASAAILSRGLPQLWCSPLTTAAPPRRRALITRLLVAHRWAPEPPSCARHHR